MSMGYLLTVTIDDFAGGRAVTLRGTILDKEPIPAPSQMFYPDAEAKKNYYYLPSASW